MSPWRPFLPVWLLVVAGLLVGLFLPPLIYMFNQGLGLADELGVVATYGKIPALLYLIEAVLAARQKAQALGYGVLILSSMITGETAWRFTTGARVDSPPTIYRGRVLFGSADGWVYCLRASDGVLAWRFRAAPAERLIPMYGALTSTWPAAIV